MVIVANDLSSQGGSTISAHRLWNMIVPHDAINYVFLNETITQLYDQEMHTAWLMDVAMGIAVAISCIGYR